MATTLSAWSPRFIEARDAAQGVPGGAQALAFAAWDLRVSMLYRAWKLRVGTEPTAEDLLNLNAIYYQFADANGQPLPVLPTRFDPALPRNVVGLDLTDGHLRSFARLAHPVTWGTRAEIELSALPASAHGSVQKSWAPVRATSFATHTLALLHAYAQVHAALPATFESMLEYFALVPVGFQPTFAVPEKGSPCLVIVRWDPTQQAVWIEQTPAGSPVESPVQFFQFNYTTGEVSLDKRPLAAVPEARSWPIFVVASLPELEVSPGAGD